MRKTMKRCLTATLGALAFVAAGFGVSGLKTANVAKAENTNLKIAGKTLNVSDNVNVVFYVPKSAGEKSAITVHVTEQEKTGAKEVTLSAASTNYTHEGTEYYRFVYSGVMAYEMSNELYAYAQLGDEKSAEVKYSVLEYAYKKLGKANKAKDETAGLEDLLTAMLGYGSAAARFTDNTLPADFSYEDDYTYVSVANATFEDSFNYGIFKKGDAIEITPNTGCEFVAGTENFTDNGNNTYTYTVPESDSKIDLSGAFVDKTDDMSIEEKIAAVKGLLVYTRTTAELGESDTLTMENQAYPDVKISWSADNATIDGSKVIFNKAGNVTLTATISNESGDVKDTVTFETILVTFPESATYIFSNYPAGTQYADNEEHVLDKYVTVKTTDCHFTSELRIYSSSTNNGFAVIDTNNWLYITAITINAGNNSDTVKVYGCDDGTSWSEIGDIAVTSTSYNDYTLQIAGGYKYLKLDVVGSQQVRIKGMTLSFSDSNEVSEQAKIEKTKAELTAMNLPKTITESYVKDSLPGNGTTYDDIEIVWLIKDAEGNDVSEDIATLDGDLLTIKTPMVDAEVVLCAMIAGQEEAWEHTFVIEYTAPEEPGEGGAGEAEAFEITFTLGANGAAEHKDGSTAKTTYSETVDGYTLNITGGEKMYPTSYDAKGNSCIKFGTGSVVGKCSFTVPEEVTEVVIYVAKYKANASKINVNGTPYTLTKNSNDGAYDAIVVDTTTNKTVSFATVSGGVRAMLNTIVFKGAK